MVGTAATFFGFGALGFLVGALEALLAFDGVFALGGLAAGPLARTFRFSATGTTAFFEAAAGFLPGFLAMAFLGPVTALGAAARCDFGFGVADSDLPAESLNDPDAPFPLVCTRAPDATAVFKYFLMNGASFSASSLYVEETYFLIACRDDPPRSFRLLIAAFTISEVRGCAGFERGFFDLAAAPFFDGEA